MYCTCCAVQQGIFQVHGTATRASIAQISLPRPARAPLIISLPVSQLVEYCARPIPPSSQVPGLGYVADILKSFLEWVEENPGLGAVAFACVYIFTTVSFIPGSLLTLGAGLVFGRALGTGIGVLVGSVAVLVSTVQDHNGYKMVRYSTSSSPFSDILKNRNVSSIHARCTALC